MRNKTIACNRCVNRDYPEDLEPCRSCLANEDNFHPGFKLASDADKGSELVFLGKIETLDEGLLDILKENGFYLIHKTMNGRYNDVGWYEILAKKEG